MCCLAGPLASAVGGQGTASSSHGEIRGMTISCQTWGPEWGLPELEQELSDLRSLGVNWIAIHPYAAIRSDGEVRPLGGELDPASPPDWLRLPIERAHRAGLAILVKPHLAYWGSPFRWRGEIEFAASEARERFWRGYTAWIVDLARIAHAADALCVGTELDRMLGDEERWRALVAGVRAVTPAKLTYAANWDRYDDVPFWDALDAVGVQAYFPLGEVVEATAGGLDRERLRSVWAKGWESALAGLRSIHRRTGKPVVFTELGYDAWAGAPKEPWSGAGGSHFGWGTGAPGARDPGAMELQGALLDTALEVLERESTWLRGAFLWKWFVGEPGRGDHAFYLDRPHTRAVLRDAWD